MLRTANAGVRTPGYEANSFRVQVSSQRFSSKRLVMAVGILIIKL